MLDNTDIKVLDDVVVRFSGDSGDGMQLAGNMSRPAWATRFPLSPTILPTCVPRKVLWVAFRVFRFI